MRRLLLFFILIIAFFFRFNNLNWDQNFHLHPDERFLTMVTLAMSLPESLEEYFNQKISPFNPANIGFNFYVYGVFPLVLTKFLAVNLGVDNYNEITVLGRFLSALVDFLTVIFVYKTIKLLFKKFKNVSLLVLRVVPLLAAFFYSVSVYPIQAAHFFTTDTFLNFFMLGSFYFILKNLEVNRFLYFIFSSLLFALALASKISAIYIFPLNLGVLFLIVISKKNNLFKKITHYMLYMILYVVFSYLFLRIFNPYYFEKPSFFDFSLNHNFYQSIKLLMSFSNPDVWYPPAVQWINKPWYGLLLTTFLVGLGPMNFIVMMVGLVFLLKNFRLKIKNFIIFLVILWVLGYFVYQSSQFVKSIRYTIYLYPFFAIFGGVGLGVIINLVKKNILINYVIRCALCVILLFWPLLFSTIYFHSHTRVLASEWIYKNLKNDSVILGEHWDDPLPLMMEKNFGKFFRVELLPVFDPDTFEKWQKIKELLKKADYYVLSSNRGWGSIPTVPSRYPLMSKYYQVLLSGNCREQKKLTGYCFKKIKTFEPYYYQFIKYPERWVEETFTVYDHPTVLIYEKNKD